MLIAVTSPGEPENMKEVMIAETPFWASVEVKVAVNSSVTFPVPPVVEPEIETKELLLFVEEAVA